MKIPRDGAKLSNMCLFSIKLALALVAEDRGDRVFVGKGRCDDCAEIRCRLRSGNKIMKPRDCRITAAIESRGDGSLCQVLMSRSVSESLLLTGEPFRCGIGEARSTHEMKQVDSEKRNEGEDADGDDHIAPKNGIIY